MSLTGAPSRYDIDHWFGDNWFGLFGRRQTSAQVREEFTAVFMNTWWQHRAQLSGVVEFPVQDLRNEDFRAYVQRHGRKWQAIAK